MTKRLIEQLDLPKDLLSLSKQERKQLAVEIREILLEIGDVCGGHLASNLGVVELSLALHSVFESPKDKLIWDTSHQCYVHKMLTGRLSEMFSLKKAGGLSGFAKRDESIHDAFGAGHASTSLSAAIGFAAARDLDGETHSVVSIIGDASLSGGMSIEALNNIDAVKGNFICILNDNNMSISKPVGMLSNYITTLRRLPLYGFCRRFCEKSLVKIPFIGELLKRKARISLDAIRHFFVDTKADHLFDIFGFRYFGPIDGHNTQALIDALLFAKRYKGAVLIHVVTAKGKGYAPAEENPIKYHGIKPSIKKKEPIKKAAQETYTQVFSETICEIANQHKDVVVITPAMCEGSGLVKYRDQFPDRFYDVGIAEEHAITFAAGLSAGGKVPVVSIYSTFLQRGFDQVIHDVCIQKLPMVFAIDRAGLIGEDGPTHQGVFDLAFLSMIPNMIVLAPKDAKELQEMLNWAVLSKKIVAIRYPKGEASDAFGEMKAPFVYNQALTIFESIYQPSAPIDVTVLSLGATTKLAYDAIKRFCESHNKNVSLGYLRSLKPLDEVYILEMASKSKQLLVIEDGVFMGGLHAHLCQLLQKNKVYIPVHSLAVSDEFTEHASRAEQLKQYCLDEEGIYNSLKELLLEPPKHPFFIFKKKSQAKSSL